MNVTKLKENGNEFRLKSSGLTENSEEEYIKTFL